MPIKIAWHTLILTFHFFSRPLFPFYARTDANAWKARKGRMVKIRKEGWLSDYSPLYMGAAGELDEAGEDR